MVEYAIAVALSSALLTLLYLNKLINANLVEINKTILLLDQLSENLRKIWRKK